MFFVFKQKTAYDIRISDWSSDVCSSDLSAHHTCTQAPNLTEARPWGHQCTPHVHPCPQPRTGAAGSRRGATEQKRPHRRALPALRDPRCHPEAAHSGRTVTRGSATVEIGRDREVVGARGGGAVGGRAGDELVARGVSAWPACWASSRSMWR